MLSQLQNVKKESNFSPPGSESERSSRCQAMTATAACHAAKASALRRRWVRAEVRCRQTVKVL